MTHSPALTSARLAVGIAVCILVMAALTWIGPVSASAAVLESSPQHCVVDVTAVASDGAFEVSAPTCYSELAAAMEEVGLGTGIDTSLEVVAAVTLASTTIGVHYDGANFTGSSLTISGSNCLGGYLNLAATWDNRISSTISNFCGRIRHWTGYNTTGSFQDTVPSGNLSSPVNNAASSIQYLT